MSSDQKLAIDGGAPVRSEPMPRRGLMTEEEKAAVVKLFDEAIAAGTAFGYSGPCERQYEEDFVEFMGGGFADGVNSGSNAVYCALGALQLDALSEVIVPAITDPGGIMPIALLGCVPVVADADPRSYNTSAEQIEPLITERTRAIIVPHIVGEPVDMDPVIELARRHDLYVVEDCAQSHGARYKGRPVGTISDIAASSTMFGKHFTTGGQGGIVYTQNEELHWQGRRFADRGKPFNLEARGNVVAGLNCNLNEIGSAIGSVQVKRLPQMLENRRKVGEAVKEALKDRPAVSVGWQVPETECTYWYLRITLNLDAVRVDMATFQKALSAEGVSSLHGYPTAPCTFPWFANKAVFGKSGFPWDCSDYAGPKEPVSRTENVMKVFNENFCVNMHESYGRQEADDIIAALLKVENAYLK
ncbi:MAG: DegT/DnrJ/EryC1/StrS family aminotransferase [Candidatus Brocadiae bacterium]|nr:DegT/DnrJ/EryC1/StrS family aminotransferase [Candidatus Brocadiia bacterium]